MHTDGRADWDGRSCIEATATDAADGGPDAGEDNDIISEWWWWR